MLDKTRIEVSGRDVSLAADAFSEDGRRSALASVEAVPGVRLVNDDTRLVPEARPFVWSAERDVASRRDPYFDYAEVLLQISIVLASVAMLSGKRWAFYASLALAGLGALLCANGYGLFLKLPGLE